MACAVPFGDLQRIEVDGRNAAQVDRLHRLAVWSLAFGKGRDAAGRAEMVMQHALVEIIGRNARFRRLEREGVGRHKGQQPAAPPAHRAVAIHAFIEIALDLKGDLAAMATSLVQHNITPVA